MVVDELTKLKLRKLTRELKSYVGRHTELVSVYVPQGYDLSKIINQLYQEQHTATNIKSSVNRKSVIAALERMIQHLKLFPSTPPNGLAIFSGNVAEREGDLDVEVWSVEPPVPLKVRIYRCDKEFVTEPLERMISVESEYGLVVMDKKEGNIALLRGKAIIPMYHFKSAVPGKTKAGGQSAARYRRLREGAAKDFYKKIAEYMKRAYLFRDNLKGIILGGPGHTKNEFYDKDYITNEVKKKIVAIKDVGYTGYFGLQELLEKSEDILANEDVVKEKQIVERFLNYLAKKPSMVSYGYGSVLELLDKGAVETLLVSEDLDENKIIDLENRAKAVGTEVKLISTDTREGVELANLGKVAAILRYSNNS
ncbi:MAG: peptide chain release factor 1 [Nitrospiraceae bacterium]|nr:peptide chain release factor 1 [Nitrospiraceae bacterium]